MVENITLFNDTLAVGLDGEISVCENYSVLIID